MKNPMEMVKFGKEIMPVGTVFKKSINENNIWSYQRQEPSDFAEEFIFVIDAFEWADEDTGTFYDNVTMEVVANSETLAMKIAMSVLKRPFYRIKYVKQYMGK